MASHTMEREVGDRNFPVWLIGDSNPAQWQSSLKTPFDPRHPIRHNIWTALLDVIQDRVYRACKKRVDISSIYIRNAVDDPIKKPAPKDTQWSSSAENDINTLQRLIETHKPALLFCFGAFAFEFTRRAIGEQDCRGYGSWGAGRIGDEFRHRMASFDPCKINIIPLLHRSISGGKFIESHDSFCGEKEANYFEIIGATIADKILKHRDQLCIWIE